MQDPAVSGLNLWLTLNGAHRSVGLLGLAPRSAKRFSELGGQQLLLSLRVAAGRRRRAAAVVGRYSSRRAASRDRAHAQLALGRCLARSAQPTRGHPHGRQHRRARRTRSSTTHERRELMRTIMDESERLNRLVANLLSMTKLESGELALQRLPEDMAELIDSSIRALSQPSAAAAYQRPLGERAARGRRRRGAGRTGADQFAGKCAPSLRRADRRSRSRRATRATAACSCA